MGAGVGGGGELGEQPGTAEQESQPCQGGLLGEWAPQFLPGHEEHSLLLLFLLTQTGLGFRGQPPPLPAGQSLSDVFLLAYSLFPSPGWGQEAEGHWHRASEPHVGQKSLIGKTEFQFWRMNVTQQEDKVA